MRVDPRGDVWDDPRVAALLDLALAEDVGAGDRTSTALIPGGRRARGHLRAKQALVVAGLPVLPRLFARLGAVAITVHAAEGARAACGEELATLEGDARTRACVERVAGTRLVVRDTRKTLPGMRLLAKYAVRAGGGTNHRLGLDDAILVKDNHLALGGGAVPAAVAAARAAWPALPLEIECRTLAEVAAAVDACPDLILLDNMDLDGLRAAVALVAGRVPLEASGGIGPDDLPAVAATGVDFVALGCLTHSAPAADIHLKLEPVA